MEQKELEQFLDTGWMEGADLYFRGRIYRTECHGDQFGCRAFVLSWHARKVSEKEYDDDLTEEEKLHWTYLYDHTEPTEEEARLAFLMAPLFDGKPFWDVVDEIEWLEHV